MTKAHTESETRTNLLPSSRIVLAATAAMLALLVGAHGSVHADGNLLHVCANFNQLGFRVPFIAVSPFSKPHYVSHTVGDHTSLLALIEKRFLSLADGGGTRPHLTARDQYAATLEDMFDFNKAPSMNTSVPTAPPPTAGDPGCS